MSEHLIFLPAAMPFALLKSLIRRIVLRAVFLYSDVIFYMPYLVKPFFNVVSSISVPIIPAAEVSSGSLSFALVYQIPLELNSPPSFKNTSAHPFETFENFHRPKSVRHCKTGIASPGARPARIVSSTLMSTLMRGVPSSLNTNVCGVV